MTNPSIMKKNRFDTMYTRPQFHWRLTLLVVVLTVITATATKCVGQELIKLEKYRYDIMLKELGVTASNYAYRQRLKGNIDYKTVISWEKDSANHSVMSFRPDVDTDFRQAMARVDLSEMNRKDKSKDQTLVPGEFPFHVKTYTHTVLVRKKGDELKCDSCDTKEYQRISDRIKTKGPEYNRGDKLIHIHRVTNIYINDKRSINIEYLGEQKKK
jgi:hypothetical protein